MGALINGLHSSNGNGNQQQPIALTPPASLRLAGSTRGTAAATASASNVNNTNTSTTNPQTATHQFQTQFTPDDQPAGMFALKPQTINANGNGNNSTNNSPNFNGKPKSAAFANGITRHGMSGLSGSQATNGDRTAARLSGPPAAAHNSNNNHGHISKFTPDGDFGTDFGAFGGAKAAAAAAAANGQLRHGSGGSGDNANANFADFEHNAIFNAAGKEPV